MPSLLTRTYRRFSGLIPELAKFGTVGLIGSVVDLGGAAYLHGPGHMGPLKAKAISITVATVITYLGSRFWTFRHRVNQAMLREGVLFFALNIVGLLIAELVIASTNYGLSLKGGLAYNAASVLGTGFGTIFRYFAYKKWVFLAPETAEAVPYGLTEDMAYASAEHAGAFRGHAGYLGQPGPGYQGQAVAAYPGQAAYPGYPGQAGFPEAGFPEAGFAGAGFAGEAGFPRTAFPGAAAQSPYAPAHTRAQAEARWERTPADALWEQSQAGPPSGQAPVEAPQARTRSAAPWEQGQPDAPWEQGQPDGSWEQTQASVHRERNQAGPPWEILTATDADSWYRSRR